MSDTPQQCKNCAEYGSPFCEDCLDEQNKILSDNEKIKLSDTLRIIANNKRNDK
jgi:hypothetical protein